VVCLQRCTLRGIFVHTTLAEHFGLLDCALAGHALVAYVQRKAKFVGDAHRIISCSCRITFWNVV